MSIKENCTLIGLDCAENDPVDYKAGGPRYLGFDFYVRTEEVEDMKIFIREVLKEFNVPLISMHSGDTKLIESKNVWSKERIIECIKTEAAELIDAHSREFGKYYKKI